MDTTIPSIKLKQARPSAPPIGREELVEWLKYEPETGLFYWRKRPYGPGGGRRHNAGDEAGSVDSRGRRVLWLGRRRIYAGRAAFLIVNGSIPPRALVDHIDGDTTNDRIANLRLAGSAQNTWNRIGSGGLLKGVSVDRHGRFKARIDVGVGKKLNLGTWGTAEEAHAAYMGAAAVLHGDFWVGNRPAYQKGAVEALDKRRA